MIVGMKRVSIVMRSHEKVNTLRALRRIGVMHLDDVEVQSETLSQLTDRISDYETISAILKERAKKVKMPQGRQILSAGDFVVAHDHLVDLVDTEEALKENLARLTKDRDLLAPYGEFDMKGLRDIGSYGYELFFYSLEKKVLSSIETDYIPIASDGRHTVIATVGVQLPDDGRTERIHWPHTSLSETLALIEHDSSRLQQVVQEIQENVYLLPSYDFHTRVVSQEIEFEKVEEGMQESHSLISWISGYIPEDRLDQFKAFAAEQKVGYSLSDPDEEEIPPTKVKNNKVISIISPVFDLLGTVPGYREYDISMWFLMFFAVFFAMIIGDGAYGLILLTIAAGAHLKTKKANNGIILLYVMSTASIVWGAITGAWFGSQWIIENVGFLNSLVIPQISAYPEVFGLEATTAQNTVMQLCFIIGTLHLSLACVINIHKKIGEKDISLVADLGWLMMIDALYFLVLLLVIETPVNLPAITTVVLTGLLLVILFGAQGPNIPFVKGLLGGLAGLFTTFLDSISAFGNIISYIRLFAVGMASLAIAQSFNSMASMMMHGFAIPAAILILLLGHSLNFVMALLSVVVHGVRLNLLEFSGQLGMEWTGYAYEPFKETVEPTSHTLVETTIRS